MKFGFGTYLHKLRDMDLDICCVCMLYRMDSLCSTNIQDDIVDYYTNLVLRMDHIMRHCFHTHYKYYELRKGLNGMVPT